jgi:broad specificity phosphatase PhoE
LRHLIILTVLFLSCNLPVDDCVEVYLIRHAEKDRSDPLNKNPHLNEKGIERSLLWNGYFENKEVNSIYSTNYNRTIETVLPVSIAKGIKPIIYSASNINYDSFLKKEKGNTVLVVGHSNTIPGFVNKLIKDDYYKQINDTVNSNLYIVKKCSEEINHYVIQIDSLQD